MCFVAKKRVLYHLISIYLYIYLGFVVCFVASFSKDWNQSGQYALRVHKLNQNFNDDPTINHSTTSSFKNKKLVGTKGIATRSKDATRAPGLTTRNKKLLVK